MNVQDYIHVMGTWENSQHTRLSHALLGTYTLSHKCQLSLPFVTTKNDPLQVSKMAPRGSVASAESCCPQIGALPTWDSTVL